MRGSVEGLLDVWGEGAGGQGLLPPSSSSLCSPPYNSPLLLLHRRPPVCKSHVTTRVVTTHVQGNEASGSALGNFGFRALPGIPVPAQVTPGTSARPGKGGCVQSPTLGVCVWWGEVCRGVPAR